MSDDLTLQERLENVASRLGTGTRLQLLLRAIVEELQTEDGEEFWLYTLESKKILFA